MTVKTSVSLTDTQNAFARTLVERGRYPSVSAVLQRGLELVQDEEAEKAMLLELLERRMNGPFISAEEFRADTEAMIARKRAELGLED